VLGRRASALGVGGRDREIFVLATCPLQFAKAGSAATLLQQEKNNTADVQRGRVNITGQSKCYAAYTCGTKPRHIFFGFQ
jgi:hypothetical protein